MRKKRIILKRSISALVIGAVTISILAGATSASSSVNADDATASVAVFERSLFCSRYIYARYDAGI